MTTRDAYSQCPSCAEFAVLWTGTKWFCTCCGVTEAENMVCTECSTGVLCPDIPDQQYGMYTCNNPQCEHQLFRTYAEMMRVRYAEQKESQPFQPTLIPAVAPPGSLECDKCKVGYIVPSLANSVGSLFHCSNIDCEYFIKYPYAGDKKEETKVNTEPVKYQLMIFGDEVIAYDADAEVTCNRQGGSPHRHFTIIQNELDEFGNILTCTVNPGYHSKEVKDIVAELGSKGVCVYLDKNTEERIAEKPNVEVKLIAEGHPLKYWVDVRRPTGGQLVRSVGNWPLTTENYLLARAAGLRAATELNCPLVDTVEKKAVG